MSYLNERVKTLEVPEELQIFACEANQAAVEKIYVETLRPATSFANSDSDILFHVVNQ